MWLEIGSVSGPLPLKPRGALSLCCLRIAMLVLLLPWQPPLIAAERQRPFLDEPEAPRHFEEPAPWKEAGIELPPVPKDADLIEFQVDDPRSRFTYAIDRASLTVGKDRVVRYTLVIESPRGVRNLSYEGLRCDTREYKVYAYGSSRGGMRPRKSPRWQPVSADRSTKVHRDLYRYYLCEPTLSSALDRRQILDALQGTSDIRAPNFLKPW